MIKINRAGPEIAKHVAYITHDAPKPPSVIAGGNLSDYMIYAACFYTCSSPLQDRTTHFNV